ncbi:MAG TPA: shikimate dehydrogenase [bacterium]|jgi:shikimate dehydrogenase|nr:shikimate dehydrogenase [bacterium]
MKLLKPMRASGSSGADHLVFILGHPLEHTLSPAMHNAAFRALGLPWAYAPLDIVPDEVKRGLDFLRSPNVYGANVTVPYKEAVLPYLDQVEKEAQWLGSVNTIYRRGEKTIGTSTDGNGFLRSLGIWRKKLKGSRGLLIGAGGSARAIAGALAQSGVSGFYVANRSSKRAGRLVRSLLKHYPRLQIDSVFLKEGEELLRRCDWVVQATSLGLRVGDPSPFSLVRARKTAFVVDIIYHRETAFLKDARQRRLPSLGGLGMLLHQGALSFEHWTGQKAPLSVMRKALLDRLASR